MSLTRAERKRRRQQLHRAAVRLHEEQVAFSRRREMERNLAAYDAIRITERERALFEASPAYLKYQAQRRLAVGDWRAP